MSIETREFEIGDSWPVTLETEPVSVTPIPIGLGHHRNFLSPRGMPTPSQSVASRVQSVHKILVGLN